MKMLLLHWVFIEPGAVPERWTAKSFSRVQMLTNKRRSSTGLSNYRNKAGGFLKVYLFNSV